jgi:hypothetical protein
MRIFRDLDMVEYLGSGMPRILRAYSQEVFHFTENFIRIVLPSAKPEDGQRVGETNWSRQGWPLGGAEVAPIQLLSGSGLGSRRSL